MSLRTALAQHRELSRLLDEAGCQPTWRERLSMHVHPREWTTNLSVDRRIRQAIGGEREAVIARFAEERIEPGEQRWARDEDLRELQEQELSQPIVGTDAEVQERWAQRDLSVRSADQEADVEAEVEL